MPEKHPNTKRIGGPGASHENRAKPRSRKAKAPQPGAPTSGRSSRISGGGGERDKHHSHDPRHKS